MSKRNTLTPSEAHIILEKGTEPPGSGEYDQHFESGLYVCRQCDAPLYQSEAKFASGCGWPSFDEEIPGMVLRQPDADGRRVEIVCANCLGHLGHVFEGERYTDKNTRHCVNSLSMRFVSQVDAAQQFATAVFASGCYWGTEYWFAKAQGVIATTVGYAGGAVANPSYKQVCSGATGHAESVRVIFDPRETTYAALVQLFFETHDPAQIDGQGPDKGAQYRSVIFFVDQDQKETAQMYKQLLQQQGVNVATQLEPLQEFFPEGDWYHHKYYQKNGQLPYCHIYQKKFTD